MDHVCTHVHHLDLVDFGQNVFTKSRLMVSCNPIEKIQITSHYAPVTPTFLEMCPISILVNFFSFLHYILLDNHWIDHSYQFQTSQPFNETCSSPSKKKFMSSQFKRKPLISQILKSWPLVVKKVPYKFPNNIASKLSTFHAVN